MRLTARLKPWPPPVQVPVIASFVLSAPAPRSATLLKVWLMQPETVNEPAGIRTTSGAAPVAAAPAEESAAFILAAETLPPKSELQAVVAQFAQRARGIPPTPPAVDQSA